MATIYQARIHDYCQRNGIALPAHFDSPTSPERFVMIDETATPPAVSPRSTAFEKELLIWALEARAGGQMLRLMDFKRCCELALTSDGKLKRFRNFDAFTSEESKRHDDLSQSDA
jgi:hypothetical protein